MLWVTICHNCYPQLFYINRDGLYNLLVAGGVMDWDDKRVEEADVFSIIGC